ncbi:polyprenyl synthetase family protein [Streptomyces sp. NPDC097727]|uniref:polyprenyl synthetase family protein n=1 Tax=Streptomyces sp. NPDC097727 TaxID=3366092 RepID=UPI0038290844
MTRPCTTRPPPSGSAQASACRAWRSATRTHLQRRRQPADLNAVAAVLEIRHGTILLHDDIVDGDTVRDGHPIAHHALPSAFGTQEAPSAALFADNILAAALAPLPIRRSGLPAAVRGRLTE